MKNQMDRIFVPENLRRFFKDHPRIALSFSGGCDSAYLLYAAHACGADVGVYHVHSCFQPAFELADARRLAEELGYELKCIAVDVLSDAQVRDNGSDRCYHCKRRIFGEILRAAQADGFDCLMDGTNASDDAQDRPGMRALMEMGVLSPLRLCGMEKAQVREQSKQAGLFTWDKPAYACLATRIPTGTPIRAELLERVERAEAALFRLGFQDFRVRIREGGARLEMPEAEFQHLMDCRKEVLAALEGDFEEITLNLRSRRERAFL